MTPAQVFKIAFNMTAWFETSGQIYTCASGNFDGQGCSWGPRQDCIGQGSLQPLMRKMLETDPEAMATALGPLLASFKAVAAPQPTSKQLATVVADWNTPEGKLKPEWSSAFAALGKLDFVQTIFQGDATGSIAAVNDLALWIAAGKPVTVRHWCLAFDFVTQNGGFNTHLKLACNAFLLFLAPFQKDVRDRMRALVWLRSGWVYVLGNRAFAADVLARKLLIVEGVGTVHGAVIHADQQFGISDDMVTP